MSWSGGNITGAGSTSLAGGTTGSISGFAHLTGGAVLNNAGTLTHFPLTLISILVSAIPWPSFAAMDDNAGLAIFMRG